MKYNIILISLLLYSFASYAQSTRDSCANGDCRNGHGTRYTIRGAWVTQVYVGDFKDGLFEGPGRLVKPEIGNMVARTDGKYDRYYNIDTLTGNFHKGEFKGIYTEKKARWRYIGNSDAKVPDDDVIIAAVVDYDDEKNFDKITIYDDGRMVQSCMRNGRWNPKLAKKNKNKELNQAAADFLVSYKDKLRRPQQDIANKIMTVTRKEWVQCLSWDLVADERVYSGDFFNQTQYKQPPFGASFEYKVTNAKGEIIYNGSTLRFKPRASGPHTIYIKYSQDLVGGGNYVDSYNIQWYFAATWPR
ncbi:MAG: hypothetical protein ABI378_03870 [Chitinophagaceae bacterium]